MSLRNFKTIKERREYIEKLRSIRLKAIKTYPKELESQAIGNCENIIGAISVPLGVAGPLTIKGEHAQGDYFLPLSTTEGALVASVNRGCKAITLSGGTKIVSEYVGTTRAPVFRVKGIREGKKFIAWVSEHKKKIKKISQSTSSHLKLIDITPFMFGRSVYLRFAFDTCDAMGMNMVTIAVDKAIKDYITPQTGVFCIALSGNVCVDKKPSYVNFILGRGRRVWAEAKIPPQVVKKVLKTTIEEIIDTNLRKNLYGSVVSGSLGANAHFSNIIAALFIATGQDVAHTTEGSIGITTTEIVDNHLYISVYLPDLPVGTVGGGTGLPSQKEALSIIGLKERKDCLKASEFAEVVAAAVLAGELSLLASLAQGSLAEAHKRLARRRK